MIIRKRSPHPLPYMQRELFAGGTQVARLLSQRATQNAMNDDPADRGTRTGTETETGDVAAVRQTDASATWVGVVCPRCGNSIGEGSEVVLCPKCLSPNHLACWQDHGNQCGACGTTTRPVRELPAGDETLAQAPAGQPRPPTPSMDTATAGASPAVAARATRPATSRTRPHRPAGLPPTQG
jgi:hypothetical protein